MSVEDYSLRGKNFRKDLKKDNIRNFRKDLLIDGYMISIPCYLLYSESLLLAFFFCLCNHDNCWE